MIVPIGVARGVESPSGIVRDLFRANDRMNLVARSLAPEGALPLTARGGPFPLAKRPTRAVAASLRLWRRERPVGGMTGTVGTAPTGRRR